MSTEPMFDGEFEFSRNAPNAKERKRRLATDDPETMEKSLDVKRKRNKEPKRPVTASESDADDGGVTIAKRKRVAEKCPKQQIITKIGDDVTEDEDEDTRSESSAMTTTKRKKSATSSAAFMKLLELEDKAPMCVIGDCESNMFPKTVRFMNHSIPVIYDSRVHMWLKADDFARALGYKNYKSAIERFVNPSFVRPFPEVLDMSRARYGDAFRLYPVTTKTPFINEAGMIQLLLRSMIISEAAHNEKYAQLMGKTEDRDPVADADTTTTGHRGVSKHHAKPKQSADWINYQITPALMAFSKAAETGPTAKEERYMKQMNE